MTEENHKGKELFAVYLYSHEREWVDEMARKDNRSSSEWARLVLITKMPQK